MRLFGSSACTLRANGGPHHRRLGDVTLNRTTLYQFYRLGALVDRIDELLSTRM